MFAKKKSTRKTTTYTTIYLRLTVQLGGITQRFGHGHFCLCFHTNNEFTSFFDIDQSLLMRQIHRISFNAIKMIKIKTKKFHSFLSYK